MAESFSLNRMSHVLTAVRATELVLISAGLFYTIFMIRAAVSASSFYDFQLSSLKKPVSILMGWWSSPVHIYIILNFIVFLILVSSRLFHLPTLGSSNNGVEDGAGSGGDSQDGYDLLSVLTPSLSPPPAPPPRQSDRTDALPERKPKDVAAAAAAAAAAAKTITSLKNQQETDEATKERVFSDFSRLTKGEDVGKEETTVDGVEIGTSEPGFRDIHVVEEMEYYSVPASYADLPKLGEAKEIKTVVHSLDSSTEAKTIQNAAEETPKHAQISRNEKQNQLHKQLKRDKEWDEDDTMEATWRAINEGTKPQEKQLKKSETWPEPHKFVLSEEDSESAAAATLPSTPSSGGAEPKKELRKSTTFNDAYTIRRRGGLRRDSLNHEELNSLNQRCEAFIQNFNRDMRLQRQESERRYLDMISRGL